MLSLTLAMRSMHTITGTTIVFRPVARATLDGASCYVSMINLSIEAPRGCRLRVGDGSQRHHREPDPDAGRESNRVQRHPLVADRGGFIASRVNNILD